MIRLYILWFFPSILLWIESGLNIRVLQVISPISTSSSLRRHSHVQVSYFWCYSPHLHHSGVRTLSAHWFATHYYPCRWTALSSPRLQHVRLVPTPHLLGSHQTFSTSTSVSHNGNGCPPGSLYYYMNHTFSSVLPLPQRIYPYHNAFTLTTSGDQTSINVFLSKYFVEAGPGIPISSNRALCQLRFGVKWGLGFFSSWSITDQALQCCLASLLVSLTSSQVLTM